MFGRPGDWDNGVIMRFTGQFAALALGTAAITTAGTSSAADRIKDNFTFTYHIEVAGADESNVATEKELRDSGTKMVPAQPTAASRDPMKKSEPAVVSKPEPKPVPEAPAKAVPAAAKAGGDVEAPASAAQQTPPATDQDKPADTMPMKTASRTEPLFQPYLRIDTGYVMTSNPDGKGRNGPHLESETQDTGTLSIGVGTHVEEQVRVEGMLSYRSPMDLDGRDGAGNSISGEVESMSAMLNLYYDIHEAHEWLGSDTFTPYVGAGVGISMLDTDSMTAGGTTERGTQVYNLTYAAMAGVATRITDQMSLDVGYRFINLGQYEQDGSFSTGASTTATKYDDLFAHEFRAGIRYQF